MGGHSQRKGIGAIPAIDSEESEDVSQTWAFVILVQIANYLMLRRHIGLSHAEGLATMIVASMTGKAGDATVRVAGRDLIEIRLQGSSRVRLEALVADLEALSKLPLTVGQAAHLIEITVGAASGLADDCDQIKLMEEAELALVEARAERRTVVRDVSRSVATLDRIGLAGDLLGAIDRGELFLVYQPKLHVRRQMIASVEALVRWQHPAHGTVHPNDFIPMAEQSRDIATLTIWTIRQVIEDQKKLAENGRNVPIFINISGVLLTDTAFVAKACELIRMGGARIGFEITETSVIHDPQSAIAHLNIFAKLGIVIAIDDYGAGLSSLAYLKQLPARELKIDKLFITQLTSSNRDPLIVRSTIDLAHALEMEVVAEGVETPATLALLSVMGCDIVQGYLISRPIALTALITFFDEQEQRLPSTATPSFLPFAYQVKRVSG